MKMWIVLLALMVFTSVQATEQSGFINVQTSMTSADIASFGRITPYEISSIEMC